MKRILVVLATLVCCVGCTKYTPYVNSPQAHLDMGGHLPLNVQEHLRPMYRSCTPDELVDLGKIDAIEQRQFKCSAVVLQHDDWVHLVNWEAPADIAGQPQGALAAGLVALRAAQKFKVTAGTLDPTGRDNATWQTNAFQFCEVHPTDADDMKWEKGKCWNTPGTVAEVDRHGPDPRANTWDLSYLAYTGTLVRSDRIKMECLYDIRITGAQAWKNGNGITRRGNQPYPSDRNGVWMFSAGDADNFPGDCPEIKGGTDVKLVTDRKHGNNERLQVPGAGELNVVAVRQMSKEEEALLRTE
jgi:hypothetical protein